MTSIPASRSARAMIFAPRSCPSRPGLATTTRIFLVEAAMTRMIRGLPRVCVRLAPRLRKREAWGGRMARPHASPNAADLLRTEHAVARALASARDEADAYPGLLAAIGETLGCAGALWVHDSDGELQCDRARPAGAAG